MNDHLTNRLKMLVWTSKSSTNLNKANRIWLTGNMLLSEPFCPWTHSDILQYCKIQDPYFYEVSSSVLSQGIEETIALRGLFEFHM